MYLIPEGKTRKWVLHHKDGRCYRCFQRWDRERPLTLEELPMCAGWCGRKVYTKKYLNPPPGAVRVNTRGRCTTCCVSPDGPPPNSYVLARQKKAQQGDIPDLGDLPMCAGWCDRRLAPRGAVYRPQGSAAYFCKGKCAPCYRNPNGPPEGSRLAVRISTHVQHRPAALKPLPDPSTYEDEETAKARESLDAYMAARTNRLKARR